MRPANQGQRNEGSRPNRRDEQPRAAEVVNRLWIRVQKQAVRGAVEAALLDGLVEECGAGPEQQQAVGIGHGERGHLGPGE